MPEIMDQIQKGKKVRYTVNFVKIVKSLSPFSTKMQKCLIEFSQRVYG